MAGPELGRGCGRERVREGERDPEPAAVVVAKAGSGLGLGLGSWALFLILLQLLLAWQQIVEINEAHWAKSAKVFHNFSSLCSRAVAAASPLPKSQLEASPRAGFTFGSATFSDFGLRLSSPTSPRSPSHCVDLQI